VVSFGSSASLIFEIVEIGGRENEEGRRKRKRENQRSPAFVKRSEEKMERSPFHPAISFRGAIPSRIVFSDCETLPWRAWRCALEFQPDCETAVFWEYLHLPS